MKLFEQMTTNRPCWGIHLIYSSTTCFQPHAFLSTTCFLFRACFPVMPLYLYSDLHAGKCMLHSYKEKHRIPVHFIVMWQSDIIFCPKPSLYNFVTLFSAWWRSKDQSVESWSLTFSIVKVLCKFTEYSDSPLAEHLRLCLKLVLIGT